MAFISADDFISGVNLPNLDPSANDPKPEKPGPRGGGGGGGGNTGPAVRGQLIQALIQAGIIQPGLLSQELHGMGGSVDAAGSLDGKHRATMDAMSFANRAYGNPFDQRSGANANGGGGSRGGGGFGSPGLRPQQSAPKSNERLNLEAAQERQRRMADKAAEMSLYRNFMAGLFGGGNDKVRSRQESQQVFNNAGFAQRVPIVTTEERDYTPSERAQILQAIMGGMR